LAEVTTAKLRQQILKDRGLVPPKQKKVKLPIIQPEEDLTTMENIPLIGKMKYIETKYSVKLRIDIFRGSINDVCSRYGWEVDRSTISRWRKYMRRFLMEAIR
jgi:hypothetical protein